MFPCIPLEGGSPTASWLSWKLPFPTMSPKKKRAPSRWPAPGLVPTYTPPKSPPKSPTFGAAGGWKVCPRYGSGGVISAGEVGDADLDGEKKESQRNNILVGFFNGFIYKKEQRIMRYVRYFYIFLLIFYCIILYSIMYLYKITKRQYVKQETGYHLLNNPTSKHTSPQSQPLCVLMVLLKPSFEPYSGWTNSCTKRWPKRLVQKYLQWINCLERSCSWTHIKTKQMLYLLKTSGFPVLFVFFLWTWLDLGCLKSSDSKKLCPLLHSTYCLSSFHHFQSWTTGPRWKCLSTTRWRQKTSPQERNCCLNGKDQRRIKSRWPSKAATLRGWNSYLPSEKLTYPTKREVREIIDSKVPTGRGYVSSLEGRCWFEQNSKTINQWVQYKFKPRCFGT